MANISKCTQCGKPIEYIGFCSPILCIDCNKKYVEDYLATNIPEMGEIKVETEKVIVGSMKCIICNSDVSLTEYEMEYKKAVVCGTCRDAIYTIREKYLKGEL